MSLVQTKHYGRHKFTAKEPLPIQVNAMAASVAGGGAATVAFTNGGVTNAGICVDYIDYEYSVASVTGSIQISDGTLTWGPFPVAVSGLQTRQFQPPLGPFTAGSAVTVTLADGGQVKNLFAQAHIEGTEVY